MATIDLTSIINSLSKRMEDQLVSTINRSCPLLQLIATKPLYGAAVVTWNAKFGSDKGSAIADGEDVSVFNNDRVRNAVLAMTTYHDAFKINGRARVLAMATQSPAQLAELFMDSLGDSLGRLAAGIAEDMYLGDVSATPTEIQGLLGGSTPAVGATGAYATIARTGGGAAEDQWQSSVIVATDLDESGNALETLTDYGEVPLIVVAMRKLKTAITTASGTQPDLWICHPTMHEALGFAMHKDRRYVDWVRTSQGVIKLDPGYMGLDFDGVQVLEDINCPEGTMLALNTSKMELVYGASAADAVNQANGNALVEGSASGVRKPARLACRIQPLAITGDAFPFALYAYPQLKVMAPNAFGVITDLVVGPAASE
jgi:hypothetical protein